MLKKQFQKHKRRRALGRLQTSSFCLCKIYSPLRLSVSNVSDVQKFLDIKSKSQMKGLIIKHYSRVTSLSRVLLEKMVAHLVKQLLLFVKRRFIAVCITASHSILSEPVESWLQPDTTNVKINFNTFFLFMNIILRVFSLPSEIFHDSTISKFVPRVPFMSSFRFGHYNSIRSWVQVVKFFLCNYTFN
jgi:hypothetical protein